MAETRECSWDVIFTCSVATSCVSALMCAVMLLDFKCRSNRSTEYPATFICWVALCDAVSSLILAAVFSYLNLGHHTYSHHHPQRVPALQVLFGILRFSVFASQLWTAAWCIEMIRKVRSAFSRPHASFYNVVIWLLVVLNGITGLEVQNDSWEITFDGKRMHLFLGTVVMKTIFVGVAFMTLLTVAFVTLRIRHVASGPQSTCKALCLYLLYPVLFLVLNISRLRLTWFDQFPLEGSFRTLFYLVAFCSEGAIVSVTRLVESRWSKSSSGPHRVRASSSSFMRSGLAVLDQCSEDDVETLGRILENYLACECHAEEAFPTTALETLATDACDEQRDFGMLIEPWKFRLMRRAWGLQSFFRDHRTSLARKFTQGFRLRRTAGASAAFFIKCEEEGVIIKVEPSASIAGQVKTLMPGLCSHFLGDRGRNSLLCRLYGCLVLNMPGGDTLSVLIMEFVDTTPMDGNGSFNTNIVNFDVKGRSDGEDERRLRQLVQEHPSAGAALLQQEGFEALSADLEFLALQGRTDYSLFLLGRAVRVIDFLQEFDVHKRSEWTIKRLRGWREPAVQPPHVYAKRMLKFVRELHQHQRAHGVGADYNRFNSPPSLALECDGVQLFAPGRGGLPAQALSGGLS